MFSVFSRRNLPPPAMSMHLCTPLNYFDTEIGEKNRIFPQPKIVGEIWMFTLDNPRGIGQMETTYKYVHLDRTNLRQEMEHGAL
jgi:hypothetical protein